MYLYRHMLSLLMASLLLANTNAQNYTAAPNKAGDWRIFEVPTGISSALLREYAYSHQKAVLHLNDEEAVISTWNSTFGYSLMRIDNSVNIKWRARVPGFIVGSAKWKGNVIAFYTREWDFRNFLDGTHIREVSAIAFDTETGKKITEKVVFRNETNKAIQPVIHSRADGEFVQVLIRQTKNGGKERDRSWATAGITVIKLDDNLAVHSVELKATEVLKGNYIGSLVNSKGETFIITHSGKKLIAEKFDSKFAASGRIEAEALSENSGAHISLNEQNDQSVLVAFRNADRHKVQLDMYNFDFTNTAVIKGNYVLNKDQIKSWRANSKESGDKQANFDDDLFNLKMGGLVQANDKIVVLFNEIKAHVSNSGNSFGATYTNGPAVVVFFDRKLNLLSSLPIVKKLYIPTQPPIREWTLGAHVYDNRLLLVSNDGIKSKDQAAMIITIDLATMKAAAPFFTERDYTIVEGGATIWFKKNFILTKCSGEHYRVVSF